MIIKRMNKKNTLALVGSGLALGASAQSMHADTVHVSSSGDSNRTQVDDISELELLQLNELAEQLRVKGNGVVVLTNDTMEVDASELEEKKRQFEQLSQQLDQFAALKEKIDQQNQELTLLTGNRSDVHVVPITGDMSSMSEALSEQLQRMEQTIQKNQTVIEAHKDDQIKNQALNEVVQETNVVVEKGKQDLRDYENKIIEDMRMIERKSIDSMVDGGLVVDNTIIEHNKAVQPKIQQLPPNIVANENEARQEKQKIADRIQEMNAKNAVQTARSAEYRARALDNINDINQWLNTERGRLSESKAQLDEIVGQADTLEASLKQYKDASITSLSDLKTTLIGSDAPAEVITSLNQAIQTIQSSQIQVENKGTIGIEESVDFGNIGLSQTDSNGATNGTIQSTKDQVSQTLSQVQDQVNQAVNQAKQAAEQMNGSTQQMRQKIESYRTSTLSALSEFQAKMAEYQEKKAAYEKEKAEYDVKMSAYEQKKKEYDNHVREYEESYELLKQSIEKKRQEIANLPVLAQSGNLKLVGNFNEAGRGSTDYFKNLKLVSNDTKQTLDYDYLGWHSDTYITSDRPIENIRNGTNWMMRNPKVGDKMTIHNVAVDKNTGEKIDMKIVITDLGQARGNYKNGVSGETVRDSYFLAGKSANAEDKFIYMATGNLYHITFEYELVNQKGQPQRVLSSNLITDIDYRQASQLDYLDGDTITVLPPNAHMSQNGSRVVSTYNDGWAHMKSAPDGTYVTAGVASKFRYTFWGTDANPLYPWRLKPDEYDKRTENDITKVEEAFGLFGYTGVMETIPPIPLKEKKFTEPTPPNPPSISVPEKPTLSLDSIQVDPIDARISTLDIHELHAKSHTDDNYPLSLDVALIEPKNNTDPGLLLNSIEIQLPRFSNKASRDHVVSSQSSLIVRQRRNKPTRLTASGNSLTVRTKIR